MSEAAVKATTETITFKMNGASVTVPKGWTVMQAAKANKVEIPHFCWHPGLSVAGVCRFCMVRVQGRPKMEIACNLQATEGMEVFTDTDEVKEAHKWALEFHLVNHPLDCPICDQAGECGLQDYYMKVGKYQSQMTRPKVLKPKALDVGGDLVLDTERCILCSRCVRFEEEVTKTGALGIFDRGDRAIVGTYPNKKISHNYTANLVDICPVGAFTSKDFRFKQRVWFLKDKPSVCPGCSTGCHIDVFAKEQNRKYFRLKPREYSAKHHWMCDTGRHLYEHMNRENRLTAPLVRGQKKGTSTDLSTALSKVRDLLASANPAEVGLLVSAQYTNEEYEALFKFFVQDNGIKQVFAWRESNEKIEDFDGLLRRGDHNANTKGFGAIYEKYLGKKAALKNELDTMLAAKPKLVFAFCPEIASTFPSLKTQLAALETVPEVVLFGLPLELERASASVVIPSLGFAEKVGTFTNAHGEAGHLQEAFPKGVDSALSIQEFTGSLAKTNAQ